MCYRVVAELTDPGIVAHGVALKPGKPICLAASGGKPVVILPGFPTSAIFTFHEFVAPVIRLLGGRRPESQELVSARMAVKTNSEIGRTEYLLVNLVRSESGFVAYPMGKGSGSVTTFSRADGFVTIGRHTEMVAEGQEVQSVRLAAGSAIADLVVIGSHCVGLDYLLSQLQQRGVTSKLITVGSSAGLEAVRRGECDLAGIHLLDPETGEYNRPFLTDDMMLVKGYGRRQGIVYRRGDPRFEGRSIDEITPTLASDDNCVMVNRNQGSGTRILIDRLVGRRAAARLRGAGHESQRRRRGGSAGPRRLGNGDRIGGQRKRPRVPPLPGRAVRLCHPEARRERPAVKAFVATACRTDDTKCVGSGFGFRCERRQEASTCRKQISPVPSATRSPT